MKREFRPPESANYHLTTQETELLPLLIEGHYKKAAARAEKWPAFPNQPFATSYK